MAAAGVAGLALVAPTAAAAPSQTLNWGPCKPIHYATGAQCATVQVPMDYAKPDGRTISLTVSRMPARDQARKRGVLFGNPGGPGGDAIGMFAALQVPERVRDEWDLMAVQPRGLIDGTRVQCDALKPEQMDPTALGRINRERCEKNTPGYTRTITTQNTARDLEQVRRILGVNKISLYGLSYGTLLMSTYATLFPQRTDRLVLDSGVAPEWIWNDILAEQTPGYKARVNAMMSWIAQRDNIYHLGKTPLAVYRAWSAKVTAEAGVPPSLAAPPARVGDVPPGLRAFAQQYIDGVNLTADARARFENFVATMLKPVAVQATSPLLSATRMAAPNRNLWPMVALRINGKLKAPKLDPETIDVLTNLQDMQAVILCNENQAPAQPATLPASWYANYLVGDIFDGPGLLYRSGMACAGAPPVTRPVPIANKGLAVAPLQLQALGDPQTPYRGSMTMRRAMGSHLITVGGGDHGQFGRSNPAVDNAVADYLATGRTTVTSAPQAPITTPLTRAPGAGVRAGAVGVAGIPGVVGNPG
ncbi:alpha/beta hydrolase [Gordonia sinesedis]